MKKLETENQGKGKVNQKYVILLKSVYQHHVDYMNL